HLPADHYDAAGGVRGTLCEIPRRCSVRRAQLPVSPHTGHWDSRQDDLGHNHESQSACPIYWTAREGPEWRNQSSFLSQLSAVCKFVRMHHRLRYWRTPGFHGVFAINIGETFELGG